MTEINTQKQRIDWIDIIKFIAIYMMVAVHCTDNVTAEQRFEPWYNMWGSFYGSWLRPAIPLFVIATGALLLPVKQEISTFYSKRLVRVVIPFFIWSIIYNLFPWITGLLGLDASVINDFFAWGEPTQELAPALKNIAMIPLAFTYYATHMWYVYAIIGIYLYLPFFSTWVKNSTKKEQHIYLILWGASLFIPYLREFVVKDLWGTCSWNEFGMLYSFAGFNGYMLLGYYMRQNPIQWSGGKVALIGIPMFLIGYAITFFGFKHVTSTPGQPEALVELFFTYCTPNVLLMTLPIVWMAQKTTIKSAKVKGLLTNISICTFGIWMSHYLFLGPCYDLIDSLPMHVMPKIIISSILLLLVTWGFVALILKWKKYGKWIMG